MFTDMFATFCFELAAKVTARKNFGPWSVSQKAGEAATAWVANQIRRYRIPARWHAWQKITTNIKDWVTNKWNRLIGFTSIWVLIYEVWKFPFFRKSLPERHPRKHWCYWLATTVTNRSYLTLQTKNKKAAKAIFNQVFQTSVIKRML